MQLREDEKRLLSGAEGKAVKKSMEILVALGEIYGAKRLVDVSSVQIAGVSYDNLGEAGLDFLSEMAADGRVRVLTTLNPAGMDLENWQALGIDRAFAENQVRVIEAFRRMGVITSCTCTPYLVGNTPHYREHVAWSESSAVCYANSVLGARTNREGGPSALAAALTGKTAEYGLHLDENRRPSILVEVRAEVDGTAAFSAMGKAIGEKAGNRIPYITGVGGASLEELKSFCASIATYGGTALFHMEGVTPEADSTTRPEERVEVKDADIQEATRSLNDDAEVDFVSIGCPHCSIKEIARIAELLEGRKVRKEVWITTARTTKSLADQMGYTRIIEEAGAKFACDTCCVVAPIKGRFRTLCTDSAKGCYYARGKNKFKTSLRSLEECVEEALR
ncbi:MAG: aconitase X catalytic domain-containing protein [Candidatus Bathyarchaeia archaeon]